MYLTGTNPFVNVFNLTLDQCKAIEGPQKRDIYVDVPLGSYVIINVIGEDGQQKPMTTSDSFAPSIWFENKNGEWKNQPNQQDKQMQRVLYNFDPTITEITMDVQGYYLHGSVLAPDMDLKVKDGIGVHIEGTIVLEDVEAGVNSESAFLYAPFIEGSNVNFSKEVVCDTHGVVDDCGLIQETW